MKMSNLNINQDYCLRKAEFESRAYAELHPYLLDDKNQIWQVEKFHIECIEAVRQSDGVFATFNLDGSLHSHTYDDGDDIDGTTLVRELTYHEIKEYVDNSQHEILFIIKKEKPVFIDEREHQSGKYF